MLRERHASATSFVFLLACASTWVVLLAFSLQPVSAKTFQNDSSLPASPIQSTSAITSYIYLPMVGRNVSCPVLGGSYGTVAVLSSPTNPPAEIHPDLNLAMRGYTPTESTLGLIDLDGPPSGLSAPQLYALFTDQRVPIFRRLYQVYDWDWGNYVRGQPLTTWDVTLAGVGVAQGEAICAPSSGYDIGHQPTGYEVMVLYASPNRITLKFTREDNVISGYTIHIENISVDPSLLALYQSMNNAGRSYLPALFAGQHIGRAITTELQIAIRDTGEFMDPRSRKDWWQGK
jgi:hypothetical protein